MTGERRAHTTEEPGTWLLPPPTHSGASSSGHRRQPPSRCRITTTSEARRTFAGQGRRGAARDATEDEPSKPRPPSGASALDQADMFLPVDSTDLPRQGTNFVADRTYRATKPVATVRTAPT